jgi:hypothetical protein
MEWGSRWVRVRAVWGCRFYAADVMVGLHYLVGPVSPCPKAKQS